MTVFEIKDWIYKNIAGKFTDTSTLEKFTTIDEAKGHVNVVIYTNDHAYHISGSTTGYLGCVADNRKPYAGERHTRGSDLADGRFDEKTMLEILKDILSYEMVER